MRTQRHRFINDSYPQFEHGFMYVSVWKPTERVIMFGYYVLNPAQTSKFKIGFDPPTHMVISFVRSSPLDVAVKRSQPVGSFLLFFKFRFNVKTIVQITALANDRFWFTAHVISGRTMDGSFVLALSSQLWMCQQLATTLPPYPFFPYLPI